MAFVRALVQAAAIVLAFTVQPAVAEEAPKPDLAKLLDESLTAAKMPVTLTKDRLTGPGADYLKARAAESQFVLIGEEHGIATMADTVRAYFNDLKGIGYRHFVVEADPYMTPKLEAMLRSSDKNAVRKFFTTGNRNLAMPFFNWQSETALARAVVEANQKPPALWGVDQIFIGAAAVLLGDVASKAQNPEARTLAASFAAQAKGNLEFLGKIDLAELQKLRALLSDAIDEPLAKLVDDMILSARIYQPFVTGQGWSAYAANLERENLMKRLFLAHYRETTARDGSAPKVFFKFGSNHMVRGLSSTHVPSLGNFVSDLALAEGKSSFHLGIVCGPGTVTASLQGPGEKCDAFFAENFAPFAAHLDPSGLTLFNLAPLKDKPKRWQSLPEDTRNLIWGYDAILVVANGKPAEFFK